MYSNGLVVFHNVHFNPLPPVLCLFTVTDAFMIRKPLMAGFCAVAEVCGVHGEEERREDGPCVADHLTHNVASAIQDTREASTCIAVSVSPRRVGLIVLKALEKSKKSKATHITLSLQTLQTNLT